MEKPDSTRAKVIKSTYYSNWADLFGYPLAYKLLPLVARIDFFTPNIITIISFFLYTLGSILLFLSFPYHLYFAAFLIIAGYIGDDLDGQLARYKNLSSNIGDFLDKVLDVLKIYIITISISIAVYINTNEVLYLILGFTACFFFNFRYYIKLETMFGRINNDPQYLLKSAQKRKDLESAIEKEYARSPKTIWETIKVLWHKNRIIFWVDEAEFAVFTAVGALFGKLDLVLWILAISQVIIVSWRFYERISQIKTSSPRLLWPMRK
jgi:hypothetical protein